MALSWAVVQLLNTGSGESLTAFSLRWREAIQIKYAAFWLSGYHEAPPNGTEDEKDAVDEALARELPALAWFIDHYRAPEHLQEPTDVTDAEHT